MKLWIKFALVLVLAGAGAAALILAYRQGSKERELESAGEQAVGTGSKARRTEGGAIELSLDEGAQSRIGMRVESLKAVRLSPELKGYGVVVDPAPLVALATELAGAEASLEASKAEFERVKTLLTQGNASTRAVQAADAAARRDEIQIRSVREKILLGYGEAISGQGDLATFVHALDTHASALVRIDLPPGASPPNAPAPARLFAAAGEAGGVTARWLGRAPAVDPQTQGLGLLFLAQTNTPWLLPGMAVIGFVAQGGDPVSGFAVPRSAVVRLAGQSWFYEQTGKDTFRRRMLELDYPWDDGWFMKDPPEPEVRAVVGGAQALLSEEQKQLIAMPD